MVSAFGILVIYVVGGLTFLPLCLVAVLSLIFYSSPIVEDASGKTGIPVLPASPDDDDAEPVNVYRAGWLTVRRTYEPTADPNGATYVGMLASGYRSFLDNRSKDPRRSKPKDVFYAVLKNHVLFLYESEEQAECWAAIEVSAHDVVIFPEGNVDGELFVKRTAIELKPKKTDDEPSTPTGQPVVDGAAYDPLTGKPLPWFLFAKVNSDKEDWYHSLIISSRLNSPTSASSLATDRALFSPEDMARLVESIDAQSDAIPMRWFNAFLGRVFLTAYRTSSLEDYLTSRLVRKLKRVKLPSLLSEVQVREVNVGSSVPLFSKPMLKELTADGDASMEVHVGYVGAMRVTISTVATFTLASRTYSVRLVLAVVLRELEGTLLVKMKRPPSNRIWFGFTKEPKMRIDVEPVVSARQIKWSLVTGPIESRIRELIIESLVLPHMDDLSFFDTRTQPVSRGGVYGPFLRRERDVDTPTSSSSAAVEGAKGENVAEKPPGGTEEDLLGSAAGAEGEKVPSVSTGGDDLRQRSMGMRRRRSISEGRSGASGARDLSRSSTATAASGEGKGGKSSSIKSSSSVSSGLAAMSASIASWRENRAAAAAAAAGGSGSAASFPGPGAAEGGAGGAAGGEGRGRKSSWFAKSTASSSASTPSATTPLAAPGEADEEGFAATAAGKERKVVVDEKQQKEQDEASLKRLNEVLGVGGKRAASADRAVVVEEKREEEQETPLPAVGAGLGAGGKSNLSLTAPGLSAAGGEAKAPAEVRPLPLNEPLASSSPHSAPDVPPSLPPRHLTDSPLPLASSAASTKSTRSTRSTLSSASTRETGETGATDESATPTAATTATLTMTTESFPAPPPLPKRDRAPSLIKTLPATPPSSSSDLPPPPTDPTPSTSTTALPSFPPPPPRRRHSPSPSLPHVSPHRIPSASSSPKPPGSPTFHGSSSTASSSAAGLLASWRSGGGGANPPGGGAAGGGGGGGGAGGGGLNLRSVEGREEAKEALAAGVAQAKERFGKWSAGWGAKKKLAEAEEEGGGKTTTAPLDIPPPGRPTTPERRPALPPRQAQSSSLSLSSSPSGAAAFSPAVGSPAAAAVSAVSASPSSSSHVHRAGAPAPAPASTTGASTSPSKPSMQSGAYGAGGGGGTYKRASMMTLPGLAAKGMDQARREKVRGDHLGTGVQIGEPAAAAAAAAAPAQGGGPAVAVASPPAPDAPALPAAPVAADLSSAAGAVASSSSLAAAPASDLSSTTSTAATPSVANALPTSAPLALAAPPALPPRIPSSTVPAPSPGLVAQETLDPPLGEVEQPKEEGEKAM
ncbi:hypothetical protein JCM6882_000416 [Rhodosporidiobolus microsporus]